MENEIIYINMDDIIPNRFQPREIFDEKALNELADSIRQHGVIQPIVVRPVSNKYEIIVGERRYKASVLAGLTKIPAIVKPMDDKESSIVAFIENSHRRDVSSIEEARTIDRILKTNNMSQEELAGSLGMSQSTLANKLRLLSLPMEVQESLMRNEISERHARSLLTVKDAQKQIELLNKVKEKRMTVRELESEIKSMNNNGNMNNNFNSFLNINQFNSDNGNNFLNNNSNNTQDNNEFMSYLNNYDNQTSVMNQNTQQQEQNNNEFMNYLNNYDNNNNPVNNEDSGDSNFMNYLNNYDNNALVDNNNDDSSEGSTDFMNYLNSYDNNNPLPISENNNEFTNYLNNYDNNNPLPASNDNNDFANYLNNYDNNNPLPTSENNNEFTNYLNNYDNENPLPNNIDTNSYMNNYNNNVMLNSVNPPITSNFNANSYVEDNPNYIDASQQHVMGSVDEIINELKKTIDKIKSESKYKVDTDEVNFDDIYQITIKIDKRDF